MEIHFAYLLVFNFVFYFCWLVVFLYYVFEHLYSPDLEKLVNKVVKLCIFFHSRFSEREQTRLNSDDNTLPSKYTMDRELTDGGSGSAIRRPPMQIWNDGALGCLKEGGLNKKNDKMRAIWDQPLNPKNLRVSAGFFKVAFLSSRPELQSIHFIHASVYTPLILGTVI